MPLAPITVSMADRLMAPLDSRVTVSAAVPVPITLAMPRTAILPSVSRVTVSVCRRADHGGDADTLTLPLVSRVTVSVVPVPPIRLAMFDTLMRRRSAG